jgi:hypothetical protein
LRIECDLIPGCAQASDPASGDRSEACSPKEETMAEVKKTSLSRLFSLFVAFLGCVVSTVPLMYNVGEPVPLILMGSGVTVVALGVFLFFSM